MLRDDTVVIELPRNIVDDERSDELDIDMDEYSESMSPAPQSHLDYDSQSNVSFISTGRANVLPPAPETKSPVTRTASPRSRFWWQALEEIIVGDESSLLTADDQELLILSLEQADANRQIQAHAPELDLARKGSVERVDHKDHEQKDVEGQK